MSLPSLEELIGFFRDHALPQETDAQYARDFAPYKDATIEKNVRPCGPEDTRQWRILEYADNGDNLYFLEKPEKNTSPESSFVEIDDAHYRRLMAGTGGLTYQPEGKDGKPAPFRQAILDLCREDAKPTSAPAGASLPSRFAVFVTDKVVPALTDADILSNNPGVPALREVPFHFREAEITAIVRGIGLHSSHYAVDDFNKSRLLLFPDLTQVEAIETYINGSASPIDPQRRAAMVKALELTIAGERRAESRADKQLKLAEDAPKNIERQMNNQLLWTAAITLYTVLLSTGKADPIHKPIGYAARLVYHLIRYPFDRISKGAGRTGLDAWWKDLSAEFRYRGLSTVLKVGDNLSEMARREVISLAKDESTKDVAEKIERRINAPYRAGSAIVIAPPGWGKEVLMQNLAVRAVKGLLGEATKRSLAIADTVKKMAADGGKAAPKGLEPLFIQTNANSIMSGTKYRGDLEERLANIPKEIETALARGTLVILCIDEFHEILTAGRGMEQAVSLLENWKGHLAKGTLRIVGFSTPDEMLKAYYEAGLYDTPASRAPLSPYHRDLLDRWDKDPAAYKIARDQNRRPLLNRFLRIYANPRPLPEMRDVILKDALKQYGEDVTAETGVLDLITRLSESPMAGEGYIPREALGILDGVVNLLSEKTEIGQPIRITSDVVQDYIRSDYPEKVKTMEGSRTDASAPPSPSTEPTGQETSGHFTADHFYEMIQSRYQAQGRLIEEGLARRLAQDAHALWKQDGAKTTVVDGHLLPLENAIEKTLFKAYQTSSANNPFHSGFRAAFEADGGRLGEGRPVDSMSESFREASKKAFKAFGK